MRSSDGRRSQSKLKRSAAVVATVALASISLGLPAAADDPVTPGTADSAQAHTSARAAAPLAALDVVNGLNPFATVTGKVYMSLDAIGTNDPAGGQVFAQKNTSSSTVRSAYLLAATTPGSHIDDGVITLNGSALNFDPAHQATGVLSIESVWTDVTSIVKPVVDGAPAGKVAFTAAESTATDSIDGEILAVIMDDPTLPTDNTVSFQFGALNSAGDTYSIGLASPLNVSDPNLALTMSIGDSFGYQGGGQYSTIDVNGSRLSSSAGGNDDSSCKNNVPQNFGNCGNGELITVGGIGDDTANPSDPNATDTSCGNAPRCDDELYNLLPFVKNGDTSIVVNTTNPSNDDNIFFTGFQLNSTAAVVGEGAVLSPVSGNTPVNSPYTFTTKLQDSTGNPIANKAVTFTVLSGPNAGQTAPATTDANGNAAYTYASGSAGTDTVQVSFTGSNGSTVQSNQATVTWTAAANQPPKVADQSVTTAQDTAVGVTLAGSDPENDPLTFAVTGGPSHGTLTGSGANLTYTPNAGYSGPDSFTYTANDGTNTSNTGTVSITVTPVTPPNGAPKVADQSVATAQDTAVGVTLAGSDPENDPLTFAATGGPSHGTLTGSGANLTYTPNAGYSGPDSFTYTASDGTNTSNTGTVSITVTPAPVGCPAPAPTVDTTVSKEIKKPSATFTAPALTTAGPNELLVAFIEADGPTNTSQKVTSVTGGALSWKLAARSNQGWGTTEVWYAWAPKASSKITVTAKLAKSYDGALTVTAFKGAASTIGATGTGWATKGTPKATVTTTACNSLVWAAGHDWTSAAAVSAPAGQSLVHTFTDKGVHDSFWTQKVDGPTANAGDKVVVSTNGPAKDRWTMAAVEIRPAS
jgi:hypothetical protein